MAHRASSSDVRLVAEAMLGSDDVAEAAVEAARRLGGGTREGQTHVNLLLADTFAEILERECPTDWRTLTGLPDVVRLAAIDDDHKTAQGYVRETRRRARPAGYADGRAAVATAMNATVLAQQYLGVRRQSPAQLQRFVEEAECATQLMVDRVWGALWIACRKARLLTG